MAGRWLSRRAIGLHLTLAVVVPTFLALCDWQVHRALAGNGLSWAYVFEWPFFAGYAVYMWWRLVHEDPAFSRPPDVVGDGAAPSTTVGQDRDRPHRPGAPDRDAADLEAGQDEELAAYNRYLAALHSQDRRKHW